VSVREKIQAIALAKKVPFLVHFTRSENIPSIMQHGLVPMSIANDIGLKPTINDQLRLDGRLNGTSVLWSKDVLFCRHNAADTRVSKVSSDTLRQAETFTSLFEELEGVESRLEQGIKDCDPTDVQAEALVMEPIEPEFILGALFNDKATLDAFTPHFGKRKLILHEGRKGVFANRTYYRKFGGG
jgi:hypothetical protein